ncbi:hypothetical protein CYY_005301 [Polysphondylium violaceum]|uniref:Lipoprotein n=1 Tax=Polysphondylium violaceum TaxID=133409 RepID=A0A8J4PT63_9MYCE|nr:hypothetical protein CYY_005301 [Polysphondylium violaceum]
MKKIFVLFLIVLVGNCGAQLLDQYWEKDDLYAQITVLRQNGDCVFSRDSLKIYPYGNFLTNVNSFPAIFSRDQGCNNGHQQLFDLHKQKVSFGDRGGITIKKDGSGTYHPIWADSDGLDFQLEVKENVYYAWTHDNLLTISFTNTKPIGMICTK